MATLVHLKEKREYEETEETGPLEGLPTSDGGKVNWSFHGPCMLEPHFSRTHQIYHTEGQGRGAFSTE